jgi:hypothetical protein
MEIRLRMRRFRQQSGLVGNTMDGVFSDEIVHAEAGRFLRDVERISLSDHPPLRPPSLLLRKKWPSDTQG